MKISILGSGSEGNAAFIELAGVPVLVDAGFSGKILVERFNSVGVQPSSLKAILVTHEHIDHIKGVGILSRKFNIPIYITPESYNSSKYMLGKIAPQNLRLIDGSFTIDTLTVIPFDVCHDAVRTVGFRLEGANGKSLTITTDIGCITEEVIPYFQNVDVVVLEANYDLEMLRTCDYPYNLKRRISSSSGHFCNSDTGELIRHFYHSALRKVYLAHVSKNSNTYELALNTVKSHLEAHGLNVDLEVAYQHNPTQLFEL